MRRALIVAVLLLAPAALRAGDTTPVETSSTDATVDTSQSSSPSKLQLSYELNGDTSYVGAARTNYGLGHAGSVSEERTDLRGVLGLQENDGPIYRFGLEYQRYSFGFSKAAPMPDVMEGEYAVVGVDFDLFNSWLVRVEADPGFYDNGRDIGFRDFNVPFQIGGSYIASETVQWALGLEVDINRQIPVIPAVGVRWALNDQWVLDAILPTPRLEYEWSKSLTLYLGGDVDDGTYRMDRNFGTAVGKPKLAGAVVEYDEARIGAGVSWKAIKGVTLELEGGYLPYREFDFHRANTHFSNDDGAAYGQMSLNAQF